MIYKRIKGSRQIGNYLAGHVPQIGNYLAGHVLPNRKLFGGTVPPNSLPLKLLLIKYRQHTKLKIEPEQCSISIHY